MTLDWTNPTVQGAFIAAVISLAGIIVAALAGFFGAVIGARIGANAAREAAKISQQEAQADRDEARAAELRRSLHADFERRRTQGHRAAEAVLDAIIEADLGPYSLWNRPKRTHGTLTPAGSGPEQQALQPYHVRIRRHSHAIDDTTAKEAARLVADAMYYYTGICELSGEPASRVWWQAHTEAEEVLGAYLRGDVIPQPEYLRRTRALLEEYSEMMGTGDPD